MCTFLVRKLLNISFASSLNSDCDAIFLAAIVAKLCLDTRAVFFSADCRCSGMISLVKPL